MPCVLCGEASERDTCTDCQRANRAARGTTVRTAAVYTMDLNEAQAFGEPDPQGPAQARSYQ